MQHPYLYIETDRDLAKKDNAILILCTSIRYLNRTSKRRPHRRTHTVLSPFIFFTGFLYKILRKTSWFIFTKYLPYICFLTECSVKMSTSWYRMDTHLKYDFHVQWNYYKFSVFYSFRVHPVNIIRREHISDHRDSINSA